MAPNALIVDDDAPFAELVATLLGEDGRVVVAGRAADGPQALALALRYRPDVVLMDLNLPGFDGLEATRRIRSALAETRVVVVTSSSEPEDRDRARAAGADAFVPKSAAAERLVETILAIHTAAGAR